MFRTFMIAAASAAVITLSTTAFAQGTATEAKAMLEKAVAAVKADKAKTLDTDQQGRRWIPGPRSLCVLLQYQRRQDRCHWQQ